MGKATIRRPKTTKADSSGLLVLGIGIALAAAAYRSRALLTAVRELRWATAMDLADQGAAPFRGLLSVSMAARSMASVRGNLSLAGVCSGRCSEDDGEEPAFEQWLTWLAAQRFDGWQADAADALFSAIRSRHLRGVEILCGGLRSEGIVSALRSTPLLQLAATTRAEVAAVSRILLLADREHVSAVVSRWTARFFTPLLRLGLDPMVHDGPPCCGENALHVAASYGNAPVVEALLAHTQSMAPAHATTPAIRSAAALHALRVRSRAGLTALGLAAARGRRETACLLWAREQQYGEILYGPLTSVDLRNANGASPLHAAAAAGALEVAKLLLAAGARVAARDAQGHSCVQVACASGHAQLASMLKAHQQAGAAGAGSAAGAGGDATGS
eukprot:jgi/Chrpa1/2866/Chrysochromulina_OHIO_Genome00002084-RA